MGLSVALFRNQCEVQHLIFAKLHNQNRVLFLTFIIDEADGYYAVIQYSMVVRGLKLDVITGNFNGINIRRASFEQSVCY